jgi:CubicO group peptidase (beta-lactamase class C family)
MRHRAALPPEVTVRLNDTRTQCQCLRAGTRSPSPPTASTAIHLLFQQDRLAPTDKVFGPGALLGTTYGTQPYSSRLRAITVQHLLEHSAGGWANDANDPMFKQPALSRDALITWTLDNQPLGADPGTQYAYSNFGYCLLGRIIERVTGQSYEDFVRQAVLIPGGANQTVLAGVAATNRADAEAMYLGLNQDAPYELRIDRMDAHGGWIATPTDVLRFLFRVDGLASPPDLLQAAVQTAMTTGSAVRPPTPTMPGYARGWAVNLAAPSGTTARCLARRQSSCARRTAAPGVRPATPADRTPTSPPSSTTCCGRCRPRSRRGRVRTGRRVAAT